MYRNPSLQRPRPGGGFPLSEPKEPRGTQEEATAGKAGEKGGAEQTPERDTGPLNVLLATGCGNSRRENLKMINWLET